MPHDTTKPLPVGVGVMLVDSLGRVAVSQRLGEGPLKGYWQWPGGALKTPDELPFEAAVRELEEETGLTVDSRRIQGLAASEVRHEPYPYLAYTYILYVHDNEELINTEPDKHTNWIWVTPQFAMILNMIPGSKEYLKYATCRKRPTPLAVDVEQQVERAACDYCRYLHRGSTANGWKAQCQMFGWNLLPLGNSLLIPCPSECTHGPYLSRKEED